MKEDRLERLVGRLRIQELPPAPGNIEQNVLRSIRQRGSRENSWQQLLADSLLSFRVAMPLLAAAALVGGALGAFVIADAGGAKPSISQALDFETITDASQFELLATR